jgi:PIN domain
VLNLFIDTNVYLAFFRFGKDDLHQLDKLAVAVKSGEVRLFITDHVKREFSRNREPEIARSLDGLRQMKLPDAFPHIVRNYPEFADLQAAKRNFGSRLGSIIEQLTQDAKERTLAADKLLDELMASAETAVGNDELVAAARRRVERGDPPGKPGKLGDAINWECLLAEGPAGSDLHFVTGDADFESTIREGQMAQVLADEWSRRKGADVHLHTHLVGFFLDKFPTIKLAVDLETEIRVRRLVKSGSFAATHDAIAALSNVKDLSEQQIRDLFDAAFHNDQINRIARDPDVYDFFDRLVRSNSELFSPEEFGRFEADFHTRGWDDL